MLDVIQSCLQRDPKRRPPIEGPGGLLQHPFLQPQGSRAMQLYKQHEIMRQVIRQLRETAHDERWKQPEMISLVTKVELRLHCEF